MLGFACVIERSRSEKLFLVNFEKKLFEKKQNKNHESGSNGIEEERYEHCPHVRR